MANFQGHYDVLPNGNFVYYSDTIPSALGTGITGRVGDYCMINSFTTSGADLAWVCITAGSPGVWQVCARGVLEHELGPFSSASVSTAYPLSGGTWQLVSVKVAASAAGGTGATVNIEWLTGTAAPGSGTVQLTGAIPIGSTYTPNTVTVGTPIASPSLINGATDRIGVVLSGTLTGLVGLTVVVVLRKLS